MVLRGAATRGLPLDDRSAAGDPQPRAAQARRRRPRYVDHPHSADVPESVAVNIRRRSYTVAAALNVIELPGRGRGLLFAHGGIAGGHALFIKDGLLHYVNNWLGRTTCNGSAPTGRSRTGRHVLHPPSSARPATTRNRQRARHADPVHRRPRRGQGEIWTQPGQLGLAGTGVCVGRDSGSTVHAEDTCALQPSRVEPSSGWSWTSAATRTSTTRRKFSPGSRRD